MPPREQQLIEVVASGKYLGGGTIGLVAEKHVGDVATVTVDPMRFDDDRAGVRERLLQERGGLLALAGRGLRGVYRRKAHPLLDADIEAEVDTEYDGVAVDDPHQLCFVEILSVLWSPDAGGNLASLSLQRYLRLGTAAPREAQARFLAASPGYSR